MNLTEERGHGRARRPEPRRLVDVSPALPLFAIKRSGPRKSEDPAELRAAWRGALGATVGCPVPVPVLWGGRCLGFVRGAYGSPHAWARELEPGERWADTALGYRAAWSTYDAIVASMTAGKRLSRPWNKTSTTNPVAGNWYDLWPVGGNPTSGTYPGAARTAVQKSSTDTGAIWVGGNVSTDLKYIVSAVTWASAGATPPTLYFVDRVLTYDACTTAAANQVMTNTLAAQRYIGAGEKGLQLSITGQTVLGATASNVTQLRYTDDAGNTLQSSPVSVGNAQIVSAAAPTATLGARVIYPSITAATVALAMVVPLAAGDTGMRLVNDYTHSAANTGTHCWVLHNPLMVAPCTTAAYSAQIDNVIQIAGLERIFDGACVNAWAFFAVATGASLGTELAVGWG